MAQNFWYSTIRWDLTALTSESCIQCRSTNQPHHTWMEFERMQKHLVPGDALLQGKPWDICLDQTHSLWPIRVIILHSLVFLKTEAGKKSERSWHKYQGTCPSLEISLAFESCESTCWLINHGSTVLRDAWLSLEVLWHLLRCKERAVMREDSFYWDCIGCRRAEHSPKGNHQVEL